MPRAAVLYLTMLLLSAFFFQRCRQWVFRFVRASLNVSSLYVCWWGSALPFLTVKYVAAIQVRCCDVYGNVVSEPVVGEQKWGTWRAWATCTKGYYVSGTNLGLLGSQGTFSDDVAATALLIRCRAWATGLATASQDLIALSLGRGSWQGWRECNGPRNFMQVTRVRIESDQGCCSDDTALNGFRWDCGTAGKRGIDFYHHAL